MIYIIKWLGGLIITVKNELIPYRQGKDLNYTEQCLKIKLPKKLNQNYNEPGEIVSSLMKKDGCGLKEQITQYYTN